MPGLWGAGQRRCCSHRAALGVSCPLPALSFVAKYPIFVGFRLAAKGGSLVPPQLQGFPGNGGWQTGGHQGNPQPRHGLVPRPRPQHLCLALSRGGSWGQGAGQRGGDTGTQTHAAGPQPGCARSPAGPGAATWAGPCRSPSPRVPSLPSPPRPSPSPGLLAAAQSPHAIKAIRAPPQPGSPSLPRSLTVLNDFFEELAGGLQSPCRGWRGRRGDGDGAGAVTAARGP